MSIQILIADDHSMIREGLKQLLELDENLKVIAEASDGNEALVKIDIYKPDVLLLDINMPNRNGLEVLRELKRKKSNLKVLILTIHNEVEYLVKAVDIGCNGYVLKDSSSDVLKEAIYALHKGDMYIQPDLIPVLNEGLSSSKSSENEKLEQLTRREEEVLKLIAEGLFNKEIAAKLDISERTVKNHVSNIFKKIDVSDRTQAAVFAIKNNLVDIL